MVINTNTTSLFAQRILERSTNGLSKSLSKLSSGSRIVSPEDDAAGLAVSMKFKAELKRVDAAKANVGNAVSFSQTQDGYLQTVDTALRRMSELAVLASDQTKSDSDVENYDKEFAELKSFISRSATKTFNGVGLFSAATLADKELGTNDALVLDRYNNLTTVNTAWEAAPAAASNTGHTTIAMTGVATTGVFTSTNHGISSGTEVNVVSQAGATAGFAAGATKYYVKNVDANTFELYTDKTLTTGKVTWTANVTAAVLNKSGEHTELKNLRDAVSQLAGEWAQFEGAAATTNANDVSYGSAFTDGGGLATGIANNSTVNTTKSWADVYDFWSNRAGNTWTGVRDHGDGHSTALTQDIVHVGNAGTMSDSLIESYKKMVSDIKSYVNNNGAGIEVTDNSSGTTYQLKGADVSAITGAIDNDTNINAIKNPLTKTNGTTYVANINNLINNLAGSRAYVGANISRLNMVNSQLAVYGENLGAANSRIADVDVAVESANYAKQQILVQSGTAMLSQANLLPQSALRLLE